jgi:DNA-binding LytR/AlgR family response regulator
MQVTVHSKKPTRILVKKGIETIAVKLCDVALFYTDKGVVFVIDKTGNTFFSDKTLANLQEELDPSDFFRANRQYIINIDVIHSFRPFERVKLHVRLNIKAKISAIIVSQYSAPHFRKWISES